MKTRLVRLKHGDDIVPPGGLWPFDSWVVIGRDVGQEKFELVRARHASWVDAQGNEKNVIFVPRDEVLHWSRVVPETIRLKRVEYFPENSGNEAIKQEIAVDAVRGHGAVVMPISGYGQPATYFPFKTASEALAFADSLERFELPPIEFWYLLEGEFGPNDGFNPGSPDLHGLRIDVLGGVVEIRENEQGYTVSAEHFAAPGIFATRAGAFCAAAAGLKQLARPQ